MSSSDESEVLKLTAQLREVEKQYAAGMLARGFDISQDQNIALPSSLAKLYQEREELRARLEQLASGDQVEYGEKL